MAETGEGSSSRMLRKPHVWIMQFLSVRPLTMTPVNS